LPLPSRYLYSCHSCQVTHLAFAVGFRRTTVCAGALNISYDGRWHRLIQSPRQLDRLDGTALSRPHSERYFQIVTCSTCQTSDAPTSRNVCYASPCGPSKAAYRPGPPRVSLHRPTIRFRRLPFRSHLSIVDLQPTKAFRSQSGCPRT